ncbi:polysialyltransferase family glycosyltransferase [Vibrio sp. VB16]|uniref:polysialyltransferase family glycosyltransferase n=1 Tax=Vibrio sp. VB16 TaxID=2785746 RepID=UPI0018A0D6C6|nr:polysialyltransferase family glycosyltransferase [Vibrio sp. VB16]UGA54974.1 alpha-2,8-polysialyltransferase family protein [Vibrio sp. VB16]
MRKSLYICSTLRHLLFALSKANDDPEVSSAILFFTDFQGIDESTLDNSDLPPNIQLFFLSRKKLSTYINKTLVGKIIYSSAMRKFNLGHYFRNKLCFYLNSYIQTLCLTPQDVDIFVYNDRNKMARLFRLLADDYQMMEDGVGNYYKIPVFKQFKKVGRFIAGLPLNYWVFGEDPRCKAIHVVFPEKLPKDVRDKGVTIDFLGKKDSMKIVNTVFRFSSSINQDLDIILATQPTSKTFSPLFKDAEFLVRLNQYILKYCQERNLNIAIKLHPSELIEQYQQYYPNEQYLAVKQPLELQLLNCSTKPLIVSINSTAGLGFESFCERRKLVLDEDMGRFAEIVTAWEKEPELLKKRIEELLS